MTGSEGVVYVAKTATARCHCCIPAAVTSHGTATSYLTTILSSPSPAHQHAHCSITCSLVCCCSGCCRSCCCSCCCRALLKLLLLLQLQYGVLALLLCLDGSYSLRTTGVAQSFGSIGPLAPLWGAGGATLHACFGVREFSCFTCSN